jgi:hypothetical protein
MTELFISYSRRDTEFVQKLVADLQRHGHHVWLDTTSIPGDATWTRAIEAGITRADAVLVVVSPDSMASEWVEREIHFALSKKKPIFCLRLKRADTPLTLSGKQVIKVDGANYDHGIQRLLNDLPRSGGGTPAAAPSSPPPAAPASSAPRGINIKQRVSGSKNVRQTGYVRGDVHIGDTSGSAPGTARRSTDSPLDDRPIDIDQDVVDSENVDVQGVVDGNMHIGHGSSQPAAGPAPDKPDAPPEIESVESAGSGGGNRSNGIDNGGSEGDKNRRTQIIAALITAAAAIIAAVIMIRPSLQSDPDPTATLPPATTQAAVIVDTDVPTEPPSNTPVMAATDAPTLGSASNTPVPPPDTPIPASGDDSLRLYVDEDYLALYVTADEPVSLAGFGFGTDASGQTPYGLADFFDVLALIDNSVQPETCFVLVRDDVASALPGNCTRNRDVFYRREVASPDVFWYDSLENATRTVVIYEDADPTGEFCAAGLEECAFSYP